LIYSINYITIKYFHNEIMKMETCILYLYIFNIYIYLCLYIINSALELGIDGMTKRKYSTQQYILTHNLPKFTVHTILYCMTCFMTSYCILQRSEWLVV
jgi:diacylglycerol kinase